MKWIIFLGFASTIPLANWLIGNVGTRCVPHGPCLVPVGFGLMAPSGVLTIGLALVLRDWLHELAGAAWSVVAALVGAALSLATSTLDIAVASAAAFTLAEFSDLAVYSHLRKKNRSLAVLTSGAAGSIVDSALFVMIAFGSFEFALGIVLAKAYASVLASCALIAHSRRRRRGVSSM